MDFKINEEISLVYVDMVKIDGVDYYKYEINNLKAKKVINKYIYFNEKVAPEHIDKEKMSKCITGNVLLSDEENAFINIENFKLKKNNKTNDAGGGGSGSSSGSGTIRVENWEAFEDLSSLIKSARECHLDRVENLHKNIGSRLPNGKEYNGASNASYHAAKRIKSFGEGRGPTQVVEDYISFLNETRQEYIKIDAEEQLVKIKSRELELPEMMNDAQREAVYRDYEEALNKIISGESVPETIYDYSSLFGEIKNNYTAPTNKNWETVLTTMSLSDSAEDLKNMTDKEKENFLKNAEATRNSMYDMVKDELNITRDEFDRLLQTDQEGVSKLAELLEEKSRKDVEYRIAGVGEISDLNDVYYQFENMWYSTSAGQEALINKFIDTSITKNDPKHSMAYTDYIKYCMDRGHRYDWLREDLKGLGDVIDKINTGNIFARASDEKLSLEDQKRIEQFVGTYGYLPYGYVKDDKDNKYKAVQYTKEGEAMLYYMDYHWGEDDPNGNSGDDRVITAFSAQGKLDACERNFKSEWVENRATALSISGQMTKGNAIESAERDYDILNGNIKDNVRLEQLRKEGNVSFQDIVNYVENNGSKLINNEKETIYDKIADNEFIDDNTSSIIDERKKVKELFMISLLLVLCRLQVI